MKKLLLLLCLLPIGLLAQNNTVKPDCTIPFSFTTTASTSNLTCGNNTLGISSWIIAYTSTGFSGISLVVQSAPDAGGTPGSWGTFGGTVLTSVQYPGSSGVNPNTATTSANTGLAGFFPWMRVNLASITGTGKVTGVLYGFLNSTLAKAGGSGGSGGGPTITGNPNRIVVSGAGCTNPSTATCNIDIPTNPIFQGVATAGGFVSSEADSGNLQMNGLTSGNVTLAVADIAGTPIVYVEPTVAGTAGQVLSDSGVTTCPTLPVGSPTVCHQKVWIAAGAGGAAGGGVLGYSASALTLPTAGTTFLAPIGGALASTTEANVTANAPAAAAISNMYVTLSAAPGTGNSIAFTFRDAGSSTALTCTISGAVAVSCQDTTHSFTPVVGDALSVQVVTTGTVIIAPAVKIIAEYGVTGGGGSGNFTLISNQALASPAATVTFSSVAGFKHLKLFIQAACSSATTNQGIAMQFNGDTGNNYNRMVWLANGAGTANVQNLASSAATAPIGPIPCGSAVANIPGFMEITFYNYLGTTFFKTAKNVEGYQSSSIANGFTDISTSWFWSNTAAITSILLFPGDSSNFVTGSTFTLYGLN